MQRQVEKILGGGTMAFLLGCHLGLSKSITFWLAMGLAVLALCLLVAGCYRSYGNKSTSALAVILFFCCGALIGSGAVRQSQLEIASFIGQQVKLYGSVEAGSAKTNPQGLSFVLVCTAVQQDKPFMQETAAGINASENAAVTKAAATDAATAVAVSGKVRIFMKSKVVPEKISGQLIVGGYLKPLTDFANPGGWDGRRWNELHGLQARMTVSGSEVYLADGSPGVLDKLAAMAGTLRAKLLAAVPGQAGKVLAGMTLGGYDGIDEQTKDAFASVGLVHLLAVSGTHVALLTGFLLLVLRRHNRFTLLVLASVLFFYAALCGFKPPVMRALLMSLAFFASGSSGLLPQRSNIFCGVILLLLCYQPLWLWDAGFQLSFATTAGLIYIYPAVSNCCTRFLPAGIGSVLAVSLTAQLASLPFLVHYFHQLSLVGLLANLLLVPLLEIAVLLTLAGLALLPLFGVGQLLLVLAGALLAPLLHIILWLGNLSWATVTVGNWPYLCSAVYYLMLLLLFGSSDWDDFTDRERKFLVGFCCCTLLTVGAYDKLKPQPFTVHFIDVGQGDAALVITPQRQTLLVDTGGLRGEYDTGRRIIVPYLRYLGIRSLDMLLLSHGHHDHAGGAVAVAKAIPVKKILLPCEQPSADVQKLLQNTKALVEYAAASSDYYLGNTAVQIISAPVSSGQSGNESSLIVRVASMDGSIVFTGDATEEEELLSAGKVEQSQVLKVSHHGSNTSSCMPFLSAVRPQAAVISVGADNSYGHPGAETLHRLAGVGATVWRTDLAGAIKITFDAGQVKCYSYRYQQEFF